uniref:Uncharacterized protein n=1 Tax=Oryza meridionalis TaxID=40149 RepID=A0A0E0CSA6_9ORYZ
MLHSAGVHGGGGKGAGGEHGATKRASGAGAALREGEVYTSARMQQIGTGCYDGPRKGQHGAGAWRSCEGRGEGGVAGAGFGCTRGRLRVRARRGVDAVRPTTAAMRSACGRSGRAAAHARWSAQGGAVRLGSAPVGHGGTRRPCEVAQHRACGGSWQTTGHAGAGSS